VPAAAAGLTVPAGTRITVRTTGMASTHSSTPGEAISAVVDVSVTVGSRIAIPRGAGATLRVTGMDEGIALKLSTLVVGGRQFSLSADTINYELAPGGKQKKGVLGRVGGLVHKKHGEEGLVIPPESRLTFTLAAPLELP
jgi:hypothetical protein